MFQQNQYQMSNQGNFIFITPDNIFVRDEVVGIIMRYKYEF